MGKPTFPHGSGEVPDAVMRNTVINALGRSRQVMKAVNQPILGKGYPLCNITIIFRWPTYRLKK
jgi:hypothetical protein